MAVAVLEAEIKTFDSMLPSLRQDQGAVWVVVVGNEIVGHFNDFEDAANFAVTSHGDENFLIRHTQEHTAHIPFIAVDA